MISKHATQLDVAEQMLASLPDDPGTRAGALGWIRAVTASGQLELTPAGGAEFGRRAGEHVTLDEVSRRVALRYGAAR